MDRSSDASARRRTLATRPAGPARRPVRRSGISGAARNAGPRLVAGRRGWRSRPRRAPRPRTRSTRRLPDRPSPPGSHIGMTGGQGGPVRWDELFADLEAQADALAVAERAGEVDERMRIELGGLALGDRLRAAIGRPAHLRWPAASRSPGGSTGWASIGCWWTRAPAARRCSRSLRSCPSAGSAVRPPYQARRAW